MPCDPMHFDGITPAVVSALRDDAAKQGYVLSPLGGTLEAHGCKLSWAWDETKNALDITVAHKPFDLPCFEIRSHVIAWINGVKDSA